MPDAGVGDLNQSCTGNGTVAAEAGRYNGVAFPQLTGSHCKVAALCVDILLPCVQSSIIRDIRCGVRCNRHCAVTDGEVAGMRFNLIIGKRDTGKVNVDGIVPCIGRRGCRCRKHRTGRADERCVMGCILVVHKARKRVPERRILLPVVFEGIHCRQYQTDWRNRKYTIGGVNNIVRSKRIRFECVGEDIQTTAHILALDSRNVKSADNAFTRNELLSRSLHILIILISVRYFGLTIIYNSIIGRTQIHQTRGDTDGTLYRILIDVTDAVL